MSQTLATQLIIATVMAGLSVVIHLLGLSVLIAATNRHFRNVHAAHDRALPRQILVLVGISFGLFILHSVEIWCYATLYAAVGAIHSFEDALYFSTATYATIGYGDVTLSKSWRLLGAIEGANGVILLGWSTAFFVSIVARIRALEHNWSGVLSESPLSRVRPDVK